MKFTILAVGKLRDAWLVEGCEEYAKRLRPKTPLELVEVKDDAELVKRVAAAGRSRVWALDEKGRQWTSVELAAELERNMNAGEAGITFVIGGADGLPDEVRRRAQVTWSLGKLTLPHRIARLILLEQLYRGLSIVRGEPYHRP